MIFTDNIIKNNIINWYTINIITLSRELIFSYYICVTMVYNYCYINMAKIMIIFICYYVAYLLTIYQVEKVEIIND